MGVVGYHLFTPLFFWGWSCVDMFFVLSGYLISSIIINNSNEKGFLKSFYIRRILRIWPVYYLTLLIVIGVHAISVYFGYASYQSPSGIPLYFIFLQNIDTYFTVHPALHYIHHFQQSWSVAVEEQFYVFWPLLFIFLRPRIFIILIVAIIFSIFSVYYRSKGYEAGVLIANAHGLLWGILLAYILNEFKNGGSEKKWYIIHFDKILITLMIVGFLCIAKFLFYGYTIGFNHDEHSLKLPYASLSFVLIYFGLIGFAVKYSGHKSLLILRNPILSWFGLISYGLYMYHTVILHFSVWLIRDIMHLNSYVAIFFTLFASIGIAWLSYRFMESPILKLKSKFKY